MTAILVLFVAGEVFGSAATLLDQLGQAKTIVDGKAPPAFDRHTLKNTTIILFWASWCPHCKTAAPVIERQVKKFEGLLDIIGVSVDEDRLQAQIAFGGTYASFRPGYWIGSQLPKGRLPRLPMIAIVRPGGQIDTVYEGAQGDKIEYFRKRIRYLMGDQAPLDQASNEKPEAT